MKNKLRVMIFIGLLALFSLVTALLTRAREQAAATESNETSETNETEISDSMAPKLSKTIIVQNDLEEPIPNHELKCKQIPIKLEAVKESETTWFELTTNESGEAQLDVEKNDGVIYSCESKAPTTQDYCWYFPMTTIFFEIYDNEEKNIPVYLVSLASPDTCGKEFSEAELKNIEKYLPSGTPAPFQNKNLIPSTPTPTPEIIQPSETSEEITLWQWIVFKIKSLFRL